MSGPRPSLRLRLNQSRYPARLTVLSCAFDRFTPALSCAFDRFTPALPFGPFHSTSMIGHCNALFAKVVRSSGGLSILPYSCGDLVSSSAPPTAKSQAKATN